MMHCLYLLELVHLSSIAIYAVFFNSINSTARILSLIKYGLDKICVLSIPIIKMGAIVHVDHQIVTISPHCLIQV